MIKKLTSLFVATVSASMIVAQSIAPTLPRTTSSTTVKTNPSEGQKTGVRLDPTSKYNVAPQDFHAWSLKGGNTYRGTQVSQAPAWSKRISAPECFPNDPYLYSALSSTYHTENEGMAQGQVFGFYLNSASTLYTEMEGKTLPSGDLGSRMMYVRVADKWYCFESQRLTIVNAKTGEVERTVETDVANAGRGATYDPVKNKFYVMNFDGLIEIDGETFASTNLGGTEGFTTALAAGPDGLYYITYAGELKKFNAEGDDELIVSDIKVNSWQNQGTTAAFDWTTGKFYYTYIDNDWVCHLTTCELSADAKGEHIYDFPGKEATMMGLYFPYAAPAAPAPAASISFDGTTLNFTVPTTSTDGSALSGTLKAYVTINGEETAYDVNPGQEMALTPELAQGKVTISIEIGNDAGRSPERRVNSYAGTDVPNHVTDLVAVSEDAVNATLTWTAPTTSMNGGPVDDASINYTVVRYPDGVTVAENLTATTYTETLPTRRDHYYYVVTAYSGTQPGGSYESNKIVGGTLYYPTFVESFDTQADWDAVTVIDANQDGQTWSYAVTSFGDTYAALAGNGVDNPETGAVSTYDDDYLILLPMELKAGNDYRLTFNTYDQWMTHESMQILLGKDTQITGNEQLVADVDVLGDTKYTYIFNVPEDGEYRLIFHANTVKNSVNIYIDNIGVELYANFEGPDMVTNLTATAGEMGALVNTLTFNAPTTTYQGGALSSISRIDIYKDGSLQAVTSFDAPATGEALTWTDNDVTNGEHTYKVVAFNEQGQGKEALVTNWVGVDVPGTVPGLKVKMNDEYKAVVSWEPVSGVGAHGGYVNPDDVQYVLCRYYEWGWDNHWPEVAGPTSEFTLTDTDYYGWGQEYVKYLVVAKNVAGSSAGDEIGIVLGEPYAMPYSESFDFYGFPQPNQNPWTLFADTYYHAWQIVDGSGMAVKPFDGDKGMLVFSYVAEDSNDQRMTGPRISLKESVQPELSFYLYHGFEAEPEDLTLDIYLNYEDNGFEKAQTVAYNNGVSGWSRVSVPLRSDMKDVQIAFGANAVDASASLFIDQIKIAEGVDYDLAVENISLQEKRIEAGETGTVKVDVANYGMKALENATITLLCEDQEVATQTLESLANGATAQVSFDVPTDRRDVGKIFAFTANGACEGDGDSSNNSSSVVRLFTKGNLLPMAENLRGSEENGQLTLTWDQPATDEMTDKVTDDFEAYESFIIDGIGDWKTYDGDGTSTVYFGGPEIANAFSPKAWQIWAPEEAGFSLDRFEVLTPHSGNKVIASWAASDGISQTLPSDDWLISSDVTGGSDVSFWYRVPNDGSDPQVFEILYSTTDQESENFMVLDRDSVSGTTEWVKFEYTLPADARYFAVRNCSYGSYTVAFIDDMEYMPLFGSTSKLTLKGFNVYRDGELIATEVSGNNFNDTVIDGVKSVYNVTAVWAEGESKFSNDFESSGVNGINSIATEGQDGHYYTIDGVRVPKTSRGLFIISGNGKTRKVVVK